MGRQNMKYDKLIGDYIRATLLFEGAGCVPRGDVENCRIRTRLQNNKGRIIYLEIIGLDGHQNKANVNFCFYDDISEDRTNNYSKELYHLQFEHFTYTKNNILRFVNMRLSCSFDDIKIVNAGLHVFETDEPLCSSMDEINLADCESKQNWQVKCGK